MQIYKYLIRDATRTVYDEQERKRVRYRWMINVVALIIFMATVAEIVMQDWPMVIISSLNLLMLIIDGLIVHFFKKYGTNIAGALLVTHACIAFIYFATHGQRNFFVVMWFTVIPILGNILIGRKAGTILNVALFSIMAFFFWTPYGRTFLNDAYPRVFMAGYPMLYLIHIFTSIISETLRAYTVDELMDSRKRIFAFYDQ